MARIMVVDDEPDLVILVQRILSGAGHEVIGVESAEKALEKLREVKPDLLLLDIMMPGIDGWEMLRRIRAQEELRKVPVAMLTARTLAMEVTSRREVDELIDYIQKPITKKMLVEKVEETLRALKDIEERKKRLQGVVDEQGLERYEACARAEHLHQSLLSTLRRSVEDREPFYLDVSEEIISSEEEKVERLRERRREMERLSDI